MYKIILVFITLTFGLFFTSCGQQQSTAIKNQSNLEEVSAISDYIAGQGLADYDIATFAGGCFWCTEASFERIKGVKSVISGYSGGQIKNPSYRQVTSGSTNHAEAIQIYFDPAVVSFETLLKIFFVAHDGTQVNRQGPDVGPQYRSEIFYHGEAQKTASERYIAELNNAGKFNDSIATLVSPYKAFWVAEAYHQDYYSSNQDNPYIANVSKPKVKKVEKVFKAILKTEYK